MIHNTKTILQKKKDNEKITVLTCYDYTFACILNQSPLDIILVGDSASNIIYGNDTTLPISLDQIITLSQAVSKGAPDKMIICDIPFGTFEISEAQALATAIKVMKTDAVQAIKLEGGYSIVPSITALTSSGIPVMGHLGLRPQSVHQLGGYQVQATTEKEVQQLLNEAIALQKAGCFAIVLEKIPRKAAKTITEKLDIPTIGIGAGEYCDGQVLVLYDMLGLNPNFNPKFIRKYSNLFQTTKESIEQYIKDVKDSSFPNQNESYQ